VGMRSRAYTYIRELGGHGLRDVTNMAVLNASYLTARLREHFPLAFDEAVMHEAVFTDREIEAKTGVKTLDIAKRLIDYGVHPPTVYFPLVVRGALMSEPTETATKQTIDSFVDAMSTIKREAEASPRLDAQGPHAARFARRGA